MTLLRFCKTVLLVALLSGCKESIVHDLTEGEANRLVARFQKADVDLTKTLQADGRWSLSVEGAEAPRAIRFLDSERLLNVGGTSPQPSSLLSSKEEQQFQLEREVSRVIENTLMSIKGILQARVHLVKSTRETFTIGPTEDKQSGSVLLVVSNEFTLTVDEIAKLVAGASGIKAEVISVLVTIEEPQKQDRNGATGLVVNNLGGKFESQNSLLIGGITSCFGLVALTLLGLRSRKSVSSILHEEM